MNSNPDIFGLILEKAEHIGSISVKKDSLVFDTNIRKSSGQVNRAAFIEMGDVVYYMIVGHELKKIGKAAGQFGWYGRMAEYGKTRYNKSGKDTWDATTRKIYNHMMDNYDDGYREIQIYAVRSPKKTTMLTDHLTNTSITVEIETAETLEQFHIQLAYQQGYTLDFCREKETAK